MSASRLDARLVADGLVATRSRARDLILRGFVRVGGVTCVKPSQTCRPDACIEIASDAPAYVSRGAEKLLAALDHFGFDLTGQVALDVGASTGGFSQVLLERGARRVYAVDVGTAQLHPLLRADPRVVSLEHVDARNLAFEHVPEPIDVIVADLSFISLTKAIAPAMTLAAPGAHLVALIKPQFEAGPDAVGSGGIVRDPAIRQAAVDAVKSWIAAQPRWTILGVIASPLLGGSGNEEFLLGARTHG